MVYGEIYYVPGISVHFDACSDSVYIPGPLFEHGDEAKYNVASSTLVSVLQVTLFIF